MGCINNTTAWQDLTAHQSKIAQLHMRELFAYDALRFENYSLQTAGVLLDYSKNIITEETINLLIELANTAQLPEAIKELFAGGIVNHTENRAAQHTALRAPDTLETVEKTKAQMRELCALATSGKLIGASGKNITDIVNIGIGGSDLGPSMCVQALAHFSNNLFNCHFVSNIDGQQITDILKPLNPENTLFIISSKSFSTQETMVNGHSAKRWFDDDAIFGQHCIAVTADFDKAISFGVLEKNIFGLLDSIGGRYSIWSAIGLPLALSIGFENFEKFLNGAYEMDQHFQSAPFEKNMPVLLALLSIWYTNFFKAQSHAILPYDQSLARLPAYLQQLEMESNGKRTLNDGSFASFETAPVIWGEVGCNGQHAFHQLLHQGSHLVPADFLIATKPKHHLKEHHEILLANCFSQSQALMNGLQLDEVYSALLDKGYTEQQAQRLAPHKVVPGNRPTNTLLYEELNPYTLGALIALYEHKVYVESVIWGVNAFDQWGVELGKKLSHSILADVQNKKIDARHDSSTSGLLAFCLQLRGTS